MIEVEQREGSTWLTLAHGKANVMDLESCLALAERFQALEADGADRSPIVITGRGGIFSAGVDLKRILDGGLDYLEVFIPALEQAFHWVARCMRPVIAAVNGHAIAGGAVLAAASDLIVMRDGRGRIGVPELAVGVPFPPTALAIMRARVPSHHLREVLYTAATYAPSRALELGLVDEVVADAAFEQRVAERAAELAAIPYGAYQATKRRLHEDVLQQPGGSEGLAPTILQWSTQDTQDAIRAFVGKTLAS